MPSRSRLPLLVAAVLTVAVLGAAAMYVLRGRGPERAPAPASKLSVERITASGDVIHAAISPDGKYVSYVMSTNGQQSLWIRQLATSSALQLVPPAAVGYWGATFTPDSSAVDYVLVSTEAPDRSLFRVPVLGGTPRRLLDGLASFPVFSPDGRQIAFMREGSPDPAKSSVWVADADGGHLRMIAAREAPDFLVPIFFTAPAWSPDGSLIVCPMERRTEKTVGTLVAYRVSDGAEEPFPHYEWPGVGQAAWMPDGRGLVAIGADEGEHNLQLWAVSAREVSRRKITNDLLDYRNVSITADGTSLVTVGSEATSAIWVVPIDGSGTPSRISNGRYDGIAGVAAVADGQILYRSLESGTGSIWVMDVNGNNKRQVTTDGVASRPSAAGDSRSMVFVREGSGLWSIDLNGRNGRLIPGTKSALDPTVTPDGKWVFFVKAPNGKEEVWKVPVDGSAPPVRAVDRQAFRPAVSPDGRQLAFYYRENPSASFFLGVMPIDSGESAHPTKLFPTAPSSAFSTVRWTLDGTGLLHNTALKDRANIWLQPLAGGPARPLTQFVDQTIMAFDRSADGKRLIVARGVLSRDAILLRNFQ